MLTNLSALYGIDEKSKLRVKGLDCFVEGNIVRPYTYSHSVRELTYTCNGKPLAHPLGANFVEGVGGISYFNDFIECNLKVAYAIVGADSSQNSHFGQNVFYTTMDAYMPSQNNIPVSSYYNVLLQGIRTNVATVKFDIAYYPLKNKALSVFTEIALRYNSNELRKDKYLGVFTLLIVVHLHVLWHFGTRTDETHIAYKNINELWQLVNLVLADEISDFCNAIVL